MVSINKLKEVANKKDSETRTYQYCEGVDLIVKPVGTKDYDKALRREVEQLRRKGRNKKLKETQLTEATKQVAAKHVLVGWSGLTDDLGNELKYSAIIAKKLFDESYQFFKDVMEFAGDAEIEIREDAEERLGNSSKSSIGILNGETTPKS